MIQACPEASFELAEEQEQRTILVVDDDQDQAFCLAMRLENLGFEIVLAYTGREALALTQIDPPDLVLLDLRLPDIDGYDVCSELADDPLTSDIPVIIVSGVDGADVVRSSRAAGCRYFLHKPYDPNALLALIESAFACSEY